MSPESKPKIASFPALASLALSREQLAALARQGSLYAETSRQGKHYYKLRFRVGAKQHVRYVGSSPQFIALVQAEVAQLQARTRSASQLQRLIREANECLRRTKRQLQPLLPLAGRCFHGREIRRRPGRNGTCGL